MLKISLILLSLILFPTHLLAENNFSINELTKSDIEIMNSKELVVKFKDMPGSSWPEVTIYTLIEASPLESMGIFSALDYQQTYVPNVLKSKPVKNISATEAHTQYELHVPFPLPNAIYIHGSIIHQYKDDYELTWYMVESTSTDEVKGSAYFTAFEGKTLFRYKSFIRPKSFFASFVKSFMVRDVKKTILAITDHIQKLKKEKSPLLLKYSEYISRSLNGEFVYKISN